MTTIGTTSKPAYVYDAQTDTWIPIGFGAHTHDQYIDESIVAAKGDILIGTASDTVGILGVGSNGNLLTADSSATNGIAWLPAPVSLPTQTGNSGELLTTDGTTASWSNTLIANATTAVGLIVKGLPSQTEDLQEWQNSSGTVLSRIDSSGRFIGDGSQLTGISSDPMPQVFLLMGA
jgi:hypothetical protein